jgi:hypothetical protein
MGIQDELTPGDPGKACYLTVTVSPKMKAGRQTIQIARPDASPTQGYLHLILKYHLLKEI